MGARICGLLPICVILPWIGLTKTTKKQYSLQCKLLCLTLTCSNINFQDVSSKKLRPSSVLFLKSQLSDGFSNCSQFCTCYASKDITNDHCARLREGFVNIWDVNMFVSRVAISLRIPGLEKKSLMKITSLVYNSRVIEVYILRTNWFACCAILELLSPTRTALLCPCLQGSVCP